MIALNMQRESLGQSMAYGDDAFLDVAAKMMALIETEPAPAYAPEDVARLVEAVDKVDWTNVRSMLDHFQRNGTFWPHADEQLRILLSAISALAPFKEEK
jgi:hypothetical protein